MSKKKNQNHNQNMEESENNPRYITVTHRQGINNDINRLTTMLNSSMIPPGNSNILHRLILGKTRPGEEIWKWKIQNWDGFCHCWHLQLGLCGICRRFHHILHACTLAWGFLPARPHFTKYICTSHMSHDFISFTRFFRSIR